MKKILIALTSLCLALPIGSYADTTTENTNSSDANSAILQDIDLNTASTTSILSKMLLTLTISLFSKLPSLGTTMASMVAMPSANDNAYNNQVNMMNTLQSYYMGNTSGSTLSSNYTNIYHDYLLNNDDGTSTTTSFPDSYLSANSLFLNTNTPSYYSDEQKTAAQAFVTILSGTGSSELRKPDADWLKIDSSRDTYDQEANIRKYVTLYSQLAATQSVVDYDLSYIYSRNVGFDMSNQLEDYNDPNKKISASGLIQYTLKNKLYNTAWHTNLGAMSVSAVLKEIAELIGACLLELVNIDNVMQKELVTQSALLSLTLQNADLMLQAQAQKINK